MLHHSLDLKFPPEDPRARDVEIMGEKMELLNKIVEQILNFARSAEPKFAPVDLNALVDDLVLLTRHKLRNQGVELVRKLAPDLPPLQADAAQLEQAFLNLLLNALEAMPGGGQLTITTRSCREEDARVAVIEFKDTGQGMDEEQCRRAFKSLLSTTKPGGTGLGLAIVSRVIEAHHGNVTLKSQPGKGTTIRISLPLAEC